MIKQKNAKIKNENIDYNNKVMVSEWLTYVYVCV